MHIFIGAVIFPIVFSGCIELLQEYCTSYRGGDWLDFTANSVGVILAGVIAYFFVRPRYFL
jgi:VanZ family protein